MTQQERNRLDGNKNEQMPIDEWSRSQWLYSKSDIGAVKTIVSQPKMWFF